VAYDEDLANRIRELLGGEPATEEKKMFGGLAFLVGGHMAISASGQGGVLVRVDPEAAERLLQTTKAEPAATGFGGAGGFTAQTPAADGKLRAISGNDLTVASTSGTKVSVTMTSATVVTRSGQGAAGKLTVGDTVVVEGTKASNGKVTATSITATAAGTTSAAAGAGTPTGSGTAGGGFSGDGTAATG
jgi:Domain of unknown function (DUF5666)/TfoX N-terminal domain